jgi:hypothetical protein
MRLTGLFCIVDEALNISINIVKSKNNFFRSGQ